jgi:hypothetical protein
VQQSDRTTAATPTTGWEWQAGVLYRRRMRPWVTDAVMSSFAGTMLLLLPTCTIVPAMLKVAGASWTWSAEMCWTGRGGQTCTPAWVLLLVGGALLVGWTACVVGVVRESVDQRRSTDIPLSLDAGSLSVSIPVTFRRRGSSFSVRWDEIAAIEPDARGRARLELRLRPGAEIVPARLSGRKIPVAADTLDFAIACGDPTSDAAVLRHFLDPAARRSLTSDASAAHADRIAGAARVTGP